MHIKNAHLAKKCRIGVRCGIVLNVNFKLSIKIEGTLKELSKFKVL